MKQMILTALVAIALQASAFAAPAPKVNDKVMKAFSQTFVSAQNIQWSEYSGQYEVFFTYNDITTRVRYDKEGNTLKTLRYYYEQNLPLTVLTKVKQEYADQKVTGITEETSGGNTAYHIVVEDGKSITFLLADNTGSVVEEKSLVKA